MDKKELLDLIPAYALDALDADERAQVEDWLQQDTKAQQLLSDYQHIADQLYLLAPPQPFPSHLESDLRRRLAGDRVTMPHGTAVRRPARRPWIYFAAAAAAVVAVLLIGFVVLRALDDDSDMPESISPRELYTDLTAEENASHYTLVAGPEGETVTGELVASPDGTRAAIRADQLPPLTPDQTFQLWMVEEDGTVVSGGLFQANAEDRTAYVQVPLDEPIDVYDRMGVSIEPAGGSPYPDKPTGGNVFSVSLEF